MNLDKMASTSLISIDLFLFDEKIDQLSSGIFDFNLYEPFGLYDQFKPSPMLNEVRIIASPTLSHLSPPPSISPTILAEINKSRKIKIVYSHMPSSFQFSCPSIKVYKRRIIDVIMENMEFQSIENKKKIIHIEVWKNGCKKGEFFISRKASFYSFYKKTFQHSMCRGPIIIQWQASSITYDNWHECMHEAWCDMHVASVNIVCV